MSVSDRQALFTIGELAKRTGLAVRTIRFWSDEGIVPPTTRTSTGYRLYDTEAVARIDLVRTLRELGLDLPTVSALLQAQHTLADVAAAHVNALDSEIRTLRAQRAVLWSVARRESSTEELRIMHKLAQLSASERQRLIDNFVDEVFADIPSDAPGAHIAQGMRMLPSTLADDPTPEQVDAWVELAELLSDPDFKRVCRDMATGGAEAEIEPDPQQAERLSEAGAEGVKRELAPDSEEAATLVAAALPDVERTDWRGMADDMARFADRRVERYWHLLGILNGWERREPQVPAWEWLIAAMRAA